MIRTLSDDIGAQLARLGGTFDTYPPPKGPKLPEPIRELEQELRLPDPVDWSDGEPRAIQWAPGSNVIEGYALLQNGPWYVLATDEHFSMWIIRLDDPSQDDPTVYWLDHDDFQETAPGSSKGQLSAWLSGLEREGVTPED